ncbi:MAG: DnaJ domain-containing protein [Azoarcus sp.]|nr:DnaJ domain-containing protein [Azoarcus sp.]
MGNRERDVVKTSEARKLLGVGPEATPEAIKKAFRHLAMRWHPDRNPAPEAGEFFGRLSTACDHLLGLVPAPAHGGGGGRAASRGDDRHQDIELDIERLCLGGEVDVVLESRIDCTACGGTGYSEAGYSQLCPRCQGSGRVRLGHVLFRCEDCDGRGYTRRIRCPRCEGAGKRLERRILTVTVPPGMLPGDELRLEGEGHPAATRGRPGDLRLRVRLLPHPVYTLDGGNIVLERPVSVFALLGGGRVAVPSPAGVRHLELEPGPGEAREQRIPGAGVPARGRRAAGDLCVRFVPVLPSVPVPALVRHYRALQAEMEHAGQACAPELAAWEKRWLPGSAMQG